MGRGEQGCIAQAHGFWCLWTLSPAGYISQYCCSSLGGCVEGPIHLQARHKDMLQKALLFRGPDPLLTFGDSYEAELD